MDVKEKIDNMIKNEEDWKAELLKTLRETIHEAAPDIQEEWKWNVPVFVSKKMICAISGFKNHVKINFFKGASLKDSNKLFNAGKDSKQHRSIDFFEGDKVDKPKLIELVKEAVEYDK